MAGSKITMPANASTDWSDFVTISQHSYRHMQFVSLTNTTSTGAPAIEAGSYAVVNGTMYCLTPSTGGNETISTTGLSTGFASGELWIKVIPDSTGTSITAEFTTTPPVWSAAKGGYYSTGNDRYIGGVYKSTDRYLEKWVYEEGKKIDGGETRPILTSRDNIGYWNMDGVAFKDITLKCPCSRVVGHHGNIYTNIGPAGNFYILPHTDLIIIFRLSFAGEYVLRLSRVAGGVFDTTSYNSTSVNRGVFDYAYRG